MERGSRINILKKIFFILLIFIVLIYFVFPFIFKFIFLNNLNNESEIYESSIGSIEYKLRGDKGPIILLAHGTPGGHDQSIDPSNSYKVLTPSRPGYLRTPLSVGKTPSDQAKAFRELLDGLNIDKVIMVGVSGGGPSAVEFAAAYPDKTLGLIAIEAVSFSEDLSEEDAAGLEFSDRDTMFSFLLLSLLGDEGLAEFLLPSKDNQARLLADPKNIQSLKDLIWTIWPFSKRRDGFYNDYEQFSNLTLPLSAIKVPTIIIHGDEDINVDLEQDSDVLDTWFSSALWTFSTLDWPEKTYELDRFFPGKVLVTGFDIIFFWVARMMMMGSYFMKETPFKDIYIHPLIRDDKGQKMSKSKGNIIDPLDLLEKYGADTLRFTLTALLNPGRDVKLSEDRVKGYKSFTNKIWNAGKFLQINEAIFEDSLDLKNLK